MKRRLVLVGASFVLPGLQLAFAQAGPEVLTIVVPYPAGGIADILARTLAPPLSKQLRRNVIVENVSGASGSLAAAKVLARGAAGDTLLLGSPTELILAPAALLSAKYKAGDFRMVSLFSKVPLAVYVRTELPVNNIDELVAYAKAQGDKPLSYGSVGIGSIFHLAAEDLREAAGLRLIHIPYRGGMPMLQDLMANRLDMALFPADSNLARMVAAGKMRAICVTGTVRAQALPSVPTFAESRSLPNFNTLDVWAGVLAPAATSERAVHALYEAARAALAEPDVVKAVESALGTSLSPPMSLEQLADFYAGEVTRFAAAAKRAKLERN